MIGKNGFTRRSVCTWLLWFVGAELVIVALFASGFDVFSIFYEPSIPKSAMAAAPSPSKVAKKKTKSSTHRALATKKTHGKEETEAERSIASELGTDSGVVREPSRDVLSAAIERARSDQSAAQNIFNRGATHD